MRVWGAVLISLALAGCAVQVDRGPVAAPEKGAAAAVQPLSPEQAAGNFIHVVERVEPVAEEVCRTLSPSQNCAFQIAIDDRRNQPPNAFQTVDDAGRPVLVFTLALIASAQNEDELAFVLGHESAHHILGHIPQQQESARTGAIVAGVLASATGASAEEVRAAQDFGATVGARTYSKAFELEADALGARIALQAGFDPLVGTGFFDRLPDPGDEFLGSHPANAQRKAVVQQVVADWQRGAGY